MVLDCVVLIGGFISDIGLKSVPVVLSTIW